MTDQNPTQPARVFKIGATRIVEDPSMSALDNNAMRDLLRISYPEIANATIREREENGLQIVEFLPQPGRKG